MRLPLPKSKREPKDGTIRHVTRFLWLPKIMGSADSGVSELRWLSRATWRQIYRAESYSECGYEPAGWEDIGPFRELGTK